MQEAWRKYLGVALGVTETSRKKATKVVRKLVGRGGTTADQLQTLTSDLLAAGSANREAISKLVRFEVDRALGRVGLATADEVTQLTNRVRELEAELRQARGATGPLTEAAEPVASAPVTGPAPAAPEKKTVAKKSVAKKAAAKKTPGAAEPAHLVPPVAAPPLETSEPAEVSVAPPKAPAKKTTAKKAPKKAQPKAGDGS